MNPVVIDNLAEDNYVDDCTEFIPGEPLRNIALMFSGGGFRAASFSLGALAYLHRIQYKERPVLESVKFITSTSGGSITNGFYSVSLYQKDFDFTAFYNQLRLEMEGEKLLGHGRANNIVSYLICNMGASAGLWIISRDTILEYKTLNAQAIFSYKDIALTGATKQEDMLKFKPPMLSVINNEVVIYCNNKRKMKFYFEYGDNVTTYEPLPRKVTYRKKWIDIIRKKLLLQEQQ